MFTTHQEHNNDYTIEDSISVLIRDINHGAPLIIEGKKYFFTGFDTVSLPEHAKKLHETLCTLLKNNKEALPTFNQESDIICKYINIQHKTNTLLESSTATIEIETERLTQYTKKFTDLFLKAQKIDIQKKWKTLRI